MHLPRKGPDGDLVALVALDRREFDGVPKNRPIRPGPSVPRSVDT